jgi:hypothetical protein
MRKEGRELKHVNEYYGFPVMTGQETRMRVPLLKRVDKKGDGRFEVRYR